MSSVVSEERIPDYLLDFLQKGDWVGVPGEIVCIPDSDYVIVQPSQHFLNNPNLYQYNNVSRSWNCLVQQSEVDAWNRENSTHSQKEGFTVCGNLATAEKERREQLSENAGFSGAKESNPNELNTEAQRKKSAEKKEKFTDTRTVSPSLLEAAGLTEGGRDKKFITTIPDYSSDELDSLLTRLDN